MGELHGRARRMRRAGAALAFALLFAPRRADATYSIAAVDLGSGQAGGSGTSCVGSQLSVYEIFGAAPGFGVVMAQAALNRDARDRALELLAQGQDAPAVLAEITSPDFDLAAAVRQYAVIDARGMAVGFTGDSTMAYADDVQGRAGDVVYSVQGNILTGAAVLQQAAATFATPGCDLAETLMLALAAGAQNGQGDSRCTPDGIPSDGAFIRVDLPDGDADAPFLELQVDDTGPDDPIAALRARYDDWRSAHPCPEPEPPDAGMPAPDASLPDASLPEPSPDASTGSQAGSTAPPTAGSAAGAAGTVPVAPVAGAAGGSIAGAGGAAPIAPSSTGSESNTSGGCTVARQPVGATHDGPARLHHVLTCAVLAAALLRVRSRNRHRL